MMPGVELSLSELRSLITKAARGAGLSWGPAEEAGWAAEWLARRGIPAAVPATHWLAARVDGRISPVEVGAGLADALASSRDLPETELPDGLIAPEYLLPFLHRLTLGGRAVAITSPRGQAAWIAAAGQVAFGPSWQSPTAGWKLSASTGTARPPEPAGRPILSLSVLECLDSLALRTTVPPSATSRQDAGSMRGDND